MRQAVGLPLISSGQSGLVTACVSSALSEINQLLGNQFIAANAAVFACATRKDSLVVIAATCAPSAVARCIDCNTSSGTT